MGQPLAVTWACPGAPRAQPRRCAPVWPRYRSHRGGNDAAAWRVPAQVGADCEPGGTPPRLCLRCEEQPANASIHRKPLSAGCSPLYSTPRPKRPANNPRRGAQALRLAVLALGSGLLRLPPSERSLGSPWGSSAYNHFAFRFMTSNFTTGRKTVQRCTLP